MKGCISLLLHSMNNSVLGSNVQGAMGPKQRVRSSESGSVPLATIPPSPVVVLMKGSMPWLKMLDTAFLFLLEFPSFFFVFSFFALHMERVYHTGKNQVLFVFNSNKS